MAINPTPLSPKTKNKLMPLIVMMSIAGLLGLTAAFGIWQYLNKAQQQVKQLTVTRAVVVAGKQIPAGTKLTEGDLAIKQFPAQAIPKDYPSSIESIKGRIVKATIQPEEIITETRLVGQGAAGGLPVVIPQGQRAITIKVNEVVGVGGFINPGDRVDIVSIINKSDEQTFSKTILQNVLILAVGDKILDLNTISDPQSKIVGQVTVALNPTESEKLALAANTGQLQLILRPIGEKNITSTEGITLQDIYGNLAIPASQLANAPPIPTSANISKNVVEVILGNQRTYQYF